MDDAVEKEFRREPNPETYACLSNEEKDRELDNAIFRLRNVIYQINYFSAAEWDPSAAPKFFQK